MQDISADILAQLTPEEYKRLSRLIVKQRILDARLGDLTAFAQLVYPGYFVDAFHRDRFPSLAGTRYRSDAIHGDPLHRIQGGEGIFYWARNLLGSSDELQFVGLASSPP